MAVAAGCAFPSLVPLAVEPVALPCDTGAAGSLVLRRMDRRGHKRGLVWAKKHGTKRGSGAPLRRGSSFCKPGLVHNPETVVA